jgi:hypothetical protein
VIYPASGKNRAISRAEIGEFEKPQVPNRTANIVRLSFFTLRRPAGYKLKFRRAALVLEAKRLEIYCFKGFHALYSKLSGPLNGSGTFHLGDTGERTNPLE